MSNGNPYVEIEHEILKLKEVEFRKLITNFINYQGGNAKNVHGSNEEGVDIIVQIDEETDPFGIGSVIFLQVKVGNISMKSWRKGLHSQIIDTIFRSVKLTNTKEHISKRIILITSGGINQNVINSINNFNSRMPLSLEIIDGPQFSRLFAKKFKKTDILKLLKDEDIVTTTHETVDHKDFLGLMEEYPVDQMDYREIGTNSE
jgi:hypothetical protein